MGKTEFKIAIPEVVVKIDLKKNYNGADEVFCDWFTCPNCSNNYITYDFKYCPECGCGLIWPED